MISKLSESFRDYCAPKNQKLAQKGFPTRRYAVPVEKNLNLMVDWKVDNDNVGYGLAENHEAHGDCLIHMQTTFNRILKSRNHAYIVPKQAVVLSLAFAEFSVGRAPQEFVLTEKRELPEGAFFSYKKLSKYLQVTYLNVRGLEYLAGVCYYPPLKGIKVVDPIFDETVLSMEVKRAEQYGKEGRSEKKEWKESRTYSRYCVSSKRRVIVKVPECQEPVHFEYNYLRKRSFTTECVECAREINTYKRNQEARKITDALVKASAEKRKAEAEAKQVEKKVEEKRIEEPVKVEKVEEEKVETIQVEETKVEETEVPEEQVEVEEVEAEKVEQVEVQQVEEENVSSEDEDYDFGN